MFVFAGTFFLVSRSEAISRLPDRPAGLDVKVDTQTMGLHRRGTDCAIVLSISERECRVRVAVLGVNVEARDRDTLHPDLVTSVGGICCPAPGIAPLLLRWIEAEGVLYPARVANRN